MTENIIPEEINSYEDALIVEKCAQASLDEQCQNALEHYRGISRIVMHSSSLIERAIKEYPRLKRLESESEADEETIEVWDSVHVNLEQLSRFNPAAKLALDQFKKLREFSSIPEIEGSTL